MKELNFEKQFVLKMFSPGHYMPNVRSSSFLIRDILGSEGVFGATVDKYGTFEQTLGSSFGHSHATQGTNFPSGFYQSSFGYQDMKRGIQVFLNDKSIGEVKTRSHQLSKHHANLTH